MDVSHICVAGSDGGCTVGYDVLYSGIFIYLYISLQLSEGSDLGLQLQPHVQLLYGIHMNHDTRNH